ncbi:MAG: hypothetical protein OXO50_17020 [Caldilineaceae bacterium]|nr:hypothetical protein [Caldilineaceae bacterium]
MQVIDGSEKSEPQTISLPIRAMGVAQFRMRLHSQTLEEVIEDLLLAQLDPEKAKEMAMESLTNPWGVDS